MRRDHRRTDPHAGIKTMLAIWGCWAGRQASRSLGYPTVSPMFRDAPRGDGFGSQVPLGVSGGAGPEIYRLDFDISRLPIVQKAALVEVYQIGGSFREIAARMGVKRDALSCWLEKAYTSLVIGIDNGKKGGHNPPQFDKLSSSVSR